MVVLTFSVFLFFPLIFEINLVARGDGSFEMPDVILFFFTPRDSLKSKQVLMPILSRYV